MLTPLPALIALLQPVQVPSWETLQQAIAYDSSTPLEAKETVE